MGGNYPVAYRQPARSYHNPGIQRDYGRYTPGKPNTAEKMGRSPWYQPERPQYPVDIGRGDVYVDHDEARYNPERTDYNRGRQAVVNHQNRIWRAHYRVTPTITKRAAARAAMRGAARFIPYVGPVITAIEIAMWLYWLMHDIECGHGGTPGDIRTCFGLKQLPLGAAITDYVDPGQTYTNFYEFEGMNGPYEQWRSVGRGVLNNPWVGDGSDKWIGVWPDIQPQPEPGREYARFPWEKIDPFYRSPWDPPTNWTPWYESVPDWRSNPYRSPQEQSQRGNHEPLNDGWPLGWPRPDYSGRPFVRVWPRFPGDPVVVPSDPPAPPVVRPDPEVRPEPGPKPREPQPRPRQPDARWEEGRHEKEPPGKGEREGKYTGKVPKPIQRIIGTTTEFMDAADAAFESLPCKLRQQLMMKGGRAGKRFLTPDEKMQRVVENWRSIDINDLVYNFAKMQAEDMLIGALSRFEAKTRQKAYNQWGLQQGKSDSSKAGWAMKALRDVEKRLRLTGGANPCATGERKPKVREKKSYHLPGEVRWIK